MIATHALATVRDDIAFRDLASEAASRRIAVATLPGAQRSPAARATLDVLTDGATEYVEPGPEPAAVASRPRAQPSR